MQQLKGYLSRQPNNNTFKKTWQYIARSKRDTGAQKQVEHNKLQGRKGYNQCLIPSADDHDDDCEPLILLTMVQLRCFVVNYVEQD